VDVVNRMEPLIGTVEHESHSDLRHIL